MKLTKELIALYIKRGRENGYKDCCILQFVEDCCNGIEPASVRQGTDGGFVPCYYCGGGIKWK